MSKKDFNKTSSQQLGQKIKYLRLKKKLTQKDLATKLGSCSQGMISQVESGKRTLSTKNLYDLSRILEISLDKLLNSYLESKEAIDDIIPSEKITIYCYYTDLHTNSSNFLIAQIESQLNLSRFDYLATLHIENIAITGQFVFINNYAIGYFDDFPTNYRYILTFPEQQSSNSLYSLYGLALMHIQDSSHNISVQYCIVSPIVLSNHTLEHIHNVLFENSLTFSSNGFILSIEKINTIKSIIATLEII